MEPGSTGRLETVALERIDAGDRRWAISPAWMVDERLNVSVARSGIINPLQLEDRPDGRFRIVCGFKRLAAAQVLGLQTVPAIVLRGFTGLRLFERALFENLLSRSLNDLEKALAVDKLRGLLKIDPERLILDYLPLLHIRADRYHFERCLDLARLPEFLQQALTAGLDPDLVLRLVRWPAVDQQEFTGRLVGQSVGLNRQRRLFELLDELKAREGTTVSELWPEDEPVDRLLESLRRRRYPSLWRAEESYRRLKRRLKVAPGLQLNPPPFFEGETLSVSFAIRNPEELKTMAEYLRKLSSHPDLEKMLTIIRG